MEVTSAEFFDEWHRHFQYNEPEKGCYKRAVALAKLLNEEGIATNVRLLLILSERTVGSVYWSFNSLAHPGTRWLSHTVCAAMVNGESLVYDPILSGPVAEADYCQKMFGDQPVKMAEYEP